MRTLQPIKNKLEAIQGLSVSERGTGNGTFLFVQSVSRAVEVYMDDSNYIVEYWDSADEEADDAPVNQDVLASEAEVLAKVTRWLAPR